MGNTYFPLCSHGSPWGPWTITPTVLGKHINPSIHDPCCIYACLFIYFVFMVVLSIHIVHPSIHDKCIPDEYIFRSRSLPLAIALFLILSLSFDSFPLFLSSSFFRSRSLALATVVENDVQVKKNISLAVHTSLETFVRWFQKQLTKKYGTGIFWRKVPKRILMIFG